MMTKGMHLEVESKMNNYITFQTFVLLFLKVIKIMF